LLEGKLINSTMAHVEGVSTLAIDPNGLYLLSGSHDGSVRLWNAEKRICLQVNVLNGHWRLDMNMRKYRKGSIL